MNLQKKKKNIEKLFTKITNEHELEELVLDWGDAYATYTNFNYRLKVVRMSQVIVKQITYEESVSHLLYSLYNAYGELKGFSSDNPIRELYEEKKKELSGMKKTPLMSRYEAVCPSCGHIHKANKFRDGNYSCGKCDANHEESRLIYKRVN